MPFLLTFFTALAIFYKFPDPPAPTRTVSAIPLPPGYFRIAVYPASFHSWLGSLSLRTDPTVYLFNGQRKRNQTAQYAVINISTGNKDLQQCADAVMRLRAEYQYAQKAYASIRFHATDGTLMDYESWQKGYRFRLKNGRLTRVLAAPASAERQTFDQYLETVFSFAGTLSLQKELVTVNSPKDILPGHVFIQGGSPGHAVIVLDVAKNRAGEKIFLLAQSYMPAQDIHILNNPGNKSLSPWYKVSENDHLITPEWNFKYSHLAAFP